MAVDWDKPIRTKCGMPARYLGKLACAFFPHVVAYATRANGEQLVCVDLDGRSTRDGTTDCPWYSVEIVNVPQRHVRWLNVYENDADHCSLFKSREAADWEAEGRIACIRIEYEGGEGL